MAHRPGLLASLCLRAIRGYQRYLSPHKGFHCAYRCTTGRDGCSGYGYRVVERFGVRMGLAMLRRRMRMCGETYRRRSMAPNPKLHYQRGDCDPGCDASCIPDVPCGETCGLCSDCGSGDCGNPRRAWNDWRTRRQLRKWQAHGL